MSVPLVDRQVPSSLQDPRPDTSNDGDVAETLCIPKHSHVILIKEHHRWTCVRGSRLENNLGWAVGLIELGNAGDFAANIWNDVPVPLHAIVLMAIGGTVAGIMCIFAFVDASKSWHNVRFLWKQRQELRKELERQPEHVKPLVSIDILTEVTTRELRGEVISRWGLNLVMGGGAILVSIGTFMAIAGSNHTVWLASNILSGYLGNAPLALIGVSNAIWQAVLWNIMQSHKRDARGGLRGSPALASIKRRCFDVQMYAIVNGLSTTMGAVASMLTVTYWWAYVILIPVIISSVLCNWWWRRRIGYDRSYIDTSVRLSIQGLTDALENIARIKLMVKESPHALFEETSPRQEQMDRVIDFLVDYGLFEAFCVKLINDKKMSSVIVGPNATRVDMHAETLPELLEAHHTDFNRIAKEFLGNEGCLQLTYQDRFLAETLGTLLKHK